MPCRGSTSKTGWLWWRFARKESGLHGSASILALGFLFAIGVLSFADARPRGLSEIEYVESDDFRVSDLVAGLKFQNGELHLDTDYLRGRRLKTRVVVRSDGTGTLETIGRGKAALRWIARLKGEKPLRALD